MSKLLLYKKVHLWVDYVFVGYVNLTALSWINVLRNSYSKRIENSMEKPTVDLQITCINFTWSKDLSCVAKF